MKKNAKKAFLASALATLLCITMLVGTTFAWFTDSVTSGGNIIKSGTLNIDLGIKAKGDTDYVSVKTDATKKAFNYDKWEPGYTEWVNAKVYTTGNLALKYTLKITANGTVSNLADVIDVYYAASEVALPGTRPADLEAAGLTKIGTLKDALSGTVVIDDTLIPGTNEEDFATLALHMQESAGNEYQNLAIGTDFSLQILATQFTYEEDSFDDQYDADADFDVIFVTSIDDITSALSSSGAAKDGTVLDGNGITVGQLSTTFNDAVTVKNITFEAGNALRWCYSNAAIVFENCTFKGNVYGTHFDGGNGSVTFKNCVFYGWNSFGASLTNVAFENCEFNKSGYGCIRLYQDGEIKNCTFADEFEWVDAAKAGITVTISGCTGLPNSKLFNNSSSFTNVKWIVDGTEITGVTSH